MNVLRYQFVVFVEQQINKGEVSMLRYLYVQVQVYLFIRASEISRDRGASPTKQSLKINSKVYLCLAQSFAIFMLLPFMICAKSKLDTSDKLSNVILSPHHSSIHFPVILSFSHITYLSIFSFPSSLTPPTSQSFFAFPTLLVYQSLHSQHHCLYASTQQHTLSFSGSMFLASSTFFICAMVRGPASLPLLKLKP